MHYRIFIRHEEKLECGCCKRCCNDKSELIVAKTLEEAKEKALRFNPQCNSAYDYDFLH